MKKFRYALVALAMVAGVGAYATNQKDSNVSQTYVDANCPITGNQQCGIADDPSGSVFQLDASNNLVETPNGDIVKRQ